MTIPAGTKAPASGKGTTVWILKSTSTRAAAIAAPGDDTLFEQLGHLMAFTGPSMTKEVTTDSYLDSSAGYAEKSGGDIDPGQVKLTVAYKPGDTVQRHLYEKFNASGDAEYVLMRTMHASGAINLYYGVLSGMSAPTSAENGKLKRDYTLDLSGKQDLAEDLQTGA